MITQEADSEILMRKNKTGEDHVTDADSPLLRSQDLLLASLLDLEQRIAKETLRDRLALPCHDLSND